MTLCTFALPTFLRFLALSAGCFLTACNSTEESPVREWSPSDHTNQGSPAAGQIDTKQKRAGMEKLEAQGVNDVVFAAWKASCVTCHGLTGKGDGPQGPMMRPPDMTSAAWQRTRIDSEMAHAIKNGRGRMPSFAHLPEKTIDGLVKLVRMLSPDARRTEEAADGDTTEPAEAKPAEAKPSSPSPAQAAP